MSVYGQHGGSTTTMQPQSSSNVGVPVEDDLTTVAQQWIEFAFGMGITASAPSFTR